MGGKKRTREKTGGGKARRSRFVGVTWLNAKQKWRAGIRVAGVKQYLGCFDHEANGARAYDAAVTAQNLHYPRNFRAMKRCFVALPSLCIVVCNIILAVPFGLLNHNLSLFAAALSVATAGTTCALNFTAT